MGKFPPGELIARYAKDGMAIAQAVDMICDPSISFHKVAHNSGHDQALDALGWFRASDPPQGLAWVDVALPRKSGGA